jgi:signal transduction histidine kinase
VFSRRSKAGARLMMTAFGKLFRTTAFKLTLAYLTVFALFAVFLLGYFALNTKRLFTEQVTEVVNAEITGLVDHFNAGGIRRLTLVVEARSRRPGSSLYLVTTPNADGLAGNVGSLPTGALEKQGWSETFYRRLEETENSEAHRAMARVYHLPGGFRLLVGRDLEERDRLFQVVLDAGKWSAAVVIILGLIGGFFVARRMLRRVDAMTETTRTIMGGNLSGRLPVGTSGDELDRLAHNLNEMLDRIEALMRGLKEVSDNIAHDLKTPLTRMRNRAEEALRTANSEQDYRAALEATIEESDSLIKTFNALLMIARAESGQARDNMIDFDAAEAAQSVGELYEPLAEEQGLSLEVDAPAAVQLRGNRELIGQALANLVDNAIKYAGPLAKANGTLLKVTVSARAEGDRVLLSVADQGPGIPESERSRAVQRFVRLEKSRSIPGSGLGLSLASAVARLHGGELQLEDNAPGLKATLVLPRNGPMLQPQPQPAAAAVMPIQPRVAQAG